MSNNYKYPYEAQQKINDLERKLEASRQEVERLREREKKALIYALHTTDEDFNGRGINSFDKVCEEIWEEYQLTTKSQGGEK